MEDVREQLVGNYRIIYRIRPKLIEIIGVFHGARLLSSFQDMYYYEPGNGAS